MNLNESRVCFGRSQWKDITCNKWGRGNRVNRYYSYKSQIVGSGLNMSLKEYPQRRWCKAKVLLQNRCGENAAGFKSPDITADTNIQTKHSIPWGILFVILDSNWVHGGFMERARSNYQTKEHFSMLVGFHKPTGSTQDEGWCNLF